MTGNGMPSILLVKAVATFALILQCQVPYTKPLLVNVKKVSLSTENWQTLEYGLLPYLRTMERRRYTTY